MIGLIEGEGKLHLPRRLDHWAETDTAKEDEFFVPWFLTFERQPAIAAFSALSVVYAQFGFDTAMMPYSSGTAVDEQAILDINKTK